MRHQPTEEEGKESLISHAAGKAWEARQVYGGDSIGLTRDALERLLQDRRFVRHPVELKFDAAGLESGEFAYPQPIAEDDPSQGYILHVHPAFAGRDDALPLLVAYQLVCINYGEIAGHEAAEAFGAALCGLDTEEYYKIVCQLADSIAECNGSK